MATVDNDKCSWNWGGPHVLQRLDAGKARHLHGQPGDDREPLFAVVAIAPTLTARDARRCLRSLGVNERATIGHRLPDCWTCRKLLADEDPCGFPHGSVDEIVDDEAWRPRRGRSEAMTLRVMRTDPRAVLPEYKTAGASGMDLHACLDLPIRLWPGERRKIPTGLAFAIPAGFEGTVRGRSGWTLNGLTVHLGSIDSDFRGEVSIIVEGASDESLSVEIKPGDRIAQLVVSPCARLAIEEVESLDETVRGGAGFGSTGS